jgi:two-component system response regulator MprA
MLTGSEAVRGEQRPPRVLVVEDDAEIADVVRRSLRLEGYQVQVAGDGPQALQESELFVPDLVVLDLGLPELDGIEVCRRLRAQSDVPILVLTARDGVEDRVKGLDTGADDYLVKPFERSELLARLRALLRRRPPRGSAATVCGDLALNPATREVRRGERELDLTPREFELLEYLMHNEKLVISREKLLSDVWEYDPLADAWRSLAPEGAIPAARFRHQATFVAGLNAIVAFGGRTDASSTNELLVLAATGTIRPSISAPPPGSRLSRNSPTPTAVLWSGVMGAALYGFEHTGPGGQFANPNGTVPDRVNGYGGTGGGFVVSGTGLSVRVAPGTAPGAYHIRVIGLSADGQAVGGFSDALPLVVE